MKLEAQGFHVGLIAQKDYDCWTAARYWRLRVWVITFHWWWCWGGPCTTGWFKLVNWTSYFHPQKQYYQDSFCGPLLRKSAYQDNNLLIVIDEAHCVVEWGHKFRKDYGNLSALGAILHGVPKVAMTATAPPRYILEIIESLLLQSPTMITTCPDCSNITYEIIHQNHGGADRQGHFDTNCWWLETAKIEISTNCQMKWYSFAYKLFESILKEDLKYQPSDNDKGTIIR